MISDIDRLDSSEIELLYKAPVLVCILIAGADGNIDRKEIKEAIRFAEKRHRSSLTPVGRLFKEIAKDFEDKLKIVLQGYPYETTQRNPLIVAELSQLSFLWKKLDKTFSKEFYTTLKEIAEHIASSSGGVLGYKAVGAEEAQYVHLSMIKDPSN